MSSIPMAKSTVALQSLAFVENEAVFWLHYRNVTEPLDSDDRLLLGQDMEL